MYSSSAGHSTASFCDRIVARPGSKQLSVLFISASFIPLNLPSVRGQHFVIVTSELRLHFALSILKSPGSCTDRLQRTRLCLILTRVFNIPHVIIMTRLQQTTTRWSKSFPTVVSVPLTQYTCHYERGLKICKKTFARQCDLRSVLPLSSTIYCTDAPEVDTKRITLDRSNVHNATNASLLPRTSTDTTTACTTIQSSTSVRMTTVEMH